MNIGILHHQGEVTTFSLTLLAAKNSGIPHWPFSK